MYGKQKSDKVLYGLVALIGAVAFVLIYGTNVLTLSMMTGFLDREI